MVAIGYTPRGPYVARSGAPGPTERYIRSGLARAARTAAGAALQASPIPIPGIAQAADYATRIPGAAMDLGGWLAERGARALPVDVRDELGLGLAPDAPIPRRPLVNRATAETYLPANDRAEQVRSLFSGPTGEAAASDLWQGDPGEYAPPAAGPRVPPGAPVADLTGLRANQPDYGRPLDVMSSRGSTVGDMQSRAQAKAMLDQLYGPPRTPETGLQKRLEAARQMRKLESLLPPTVTDEGFELPKSRVRIESGGRTFTPPGTDPSGESFILPPGRGQQAPQPGSDEFTAYRLEEITAQRDEAIADLDEQVRARRLDPAEAEKRREAIYRAWQVEAQPYSRGISLMRPSDDTLGELLNR